MQNRNLNITINQHKKYVIVLDYSTSYLRCYVHPDNDYTSIQAYKMAQSRLIHFKWS